MILQLIRHSTVLYFFLALFFIKIHLAQRQCPGSFDPLADGGCYRVLTDTYAPYANFSALCNAQNADLVAIHSVRHNDILLGYLILQFYAQSLNSVFLGLHCTSESTCTWADGSPVNYTNFVDGSPDMGVGECMMMMFDTSNGKRGKWQSAPCNSYHYAVCQARTARLAPDPQSNYCSYGYEQKNRGWCYTFYRDQIFTGTVEPVYEHAPAYRHCLC
jgi:hypothetical protein